MLKKGSYKKILPFLICFFFALYFLAGLWLFRDYGISTDEPFERTTMYINLNYVTTLLGKEPMEVQELATYEDKYYGMVMQMPTAAFEIGDKGMAYIYFGRHLYTFLICIFGYIAFFLLCKNIFHSLGLAMAGTAMLMLYPRFFAEQFYNIKDMVFVAVFMMSMWAAERMITHRFSFWRTALFTFLSAVAANTRIFGFITMFLVIAYLWIVYVLEKKYKFDFYHMTLKKAMLLTLGMTGLYLFLWVAMLPGAWEHPFQSLIGMFRDYSDYDWSGKIVFMGEVFKKDGIPWFYIPVWLLISLPLWYIAGFFVSCCIGLKDIAGRIKEKKNLWLYLFFEKRYLVWSIMLFATPLLAIIILKATVYNGWRHCYFVLPPLVICILYGICAILKNSGRRVSWIVTGIIGAGLLIQTVWIGMNHPHEMVYLNLIGKEYGDQFDRDYWHLSEKQALEYITETDQSDTITVASSSPLHSIELLPEEERLRIEKREDAQYYIETYRGKVGNNSVKEGYEEIYAIWVDDFKVASVLEKIEAE